MITNRIVLFVFIFAFLILSINLGFYYFFDSSISNGHDQVGPNSDSSDEAKIKYDLEQNSDGDVDTPTPRMTKLDTHYRFRYPLFDDDVRLSEVLRWQGGVYEDCQYCSFTDYQPFVKYYTRMKEYALTAAFLSAPNTLEILTHREPDFFEIVTSLKYEVTLSTTGEERFKCSMVMSKLTESAGITCKVPEFDNCFHVTGIYGSGELLSKPNTRMLVRKCFYPMLKYDVSVCATVSVKSTPFLVEWIEMNSAAGVEHFFIYVSPGTPGKRDNNPFDSEKDTSNKNEEDIIFSDPIFAVLDDYVLEGRVTVLLWLDVFVRDKTFFAKDHFASMDDCVHRHQHLSRYIITIDDDEFIVPLNGYDTVQSLVAEFTYEEDEIVEMGMASLPSCAKRSVKYSTQVFDMFPCFNSEKVLLWNYRKMIVNPRNVVRWYTHWTESWNHSNFRYNLDDHRDIVVMHFFQRKFLASSEWLVDASETTPAEEEFAYVRKNTDMLREKSAAAIKAAQNAYKPVYQPDYGEVGNRTDLTRKVLSCYPGSGRGHESWCNVPIFNFRPFREVIPNDVKLFEV